MINRFNQRPPQFRHLATGTAPPGAPVNQPRPLSQRIYRLAGVTRDATGAPLGGCTVTVFRASDETVYGQTVSDGSGNYSFTLPHDGFTFQCDAYKPGSPDVAGTTVNTLRPS